MKIINLKLELKILGSILDCRVFLENNLEVGLWMYDAKKRILYKELPKYSIDGDSLEVKTTAKGKNGANAQLTIKIKGQKNKKMVCTIKNGSCTKKTSVKIKDLA